MPAAPHQDDRSTLTVLLFSVGEVTCALRAAHVIETMRPLPVTPLDGTAPYIRGAARIRGMSVPVLDLALMIGQLDGARGRYITIGVDGRVVALAVDEVRGVERVDASSLEARAHVLEAAAEPIVQSLISRDHSLYLVLDSMRLAAQHGINA